MSTIHHELGGSKTERIFQCPGFVALARKAPPGKPNEYAAEGTAAHIYAHALLLEMNYEESEKLQVGDWFEIDGFKIQITEEMDEHVRRYVAWIEKEIVSSDLQRGQYFFEHKVEIPIEGFDCLCGGVTSVCPSCLNCNKCAMPDCDCENSIFGTADAILHYPFEKIQVIDLKYGKGVEVKVKDNRQLLFYALGSYLAMPKWMQDDIQIVEVCIYQPRFPNRDPFRFWQYSKDELMTFQRELNRAVHKTRNPNAELNPGEEWCKFCPAAGLPCPALLAKAEATCIEEFSNMTDEGSNIIFPDFKMLKPIEKSALLDNLRLLENFISAVRSHAFIEIDENPAAIPGYKLVEGTTHRKFTDPAAIEARYKEEFGDKIYKKPALETPSGIERMLGKARKDEIKNDTYKPVGKKTLAREEDKRAALYGSGIQDFIGLEVNDETCEPIE